MFTQQRFKSMKLLTYTIMRGHESHLSEEKSAAKDTTATERYTKSLGMREDSMTIYRLPTSYPDMALKPLTSILSRIATRTTVRYSVYIM